MLLYDVLSNKTLPTTVDFTCEPTLQMQSTDQRMKQLPKLPLSLRPISVLLNHSAQAEPHIFLYMETFLPFYSFTLVYKIFLSYIKKKKKLQLLKDQFINVPNHPNARTNSKHKMMNVKEENLHKTHIHRRKIYISKPTKLVTSSPAYVLLSLGVTLYGLKILHIEF